MATQRAVIVVGGGLAGGLVALRLKALMPDLELLLIEQGDHFGGSHTWSFHGSDLPAEAAWVLPLVSKSWPGYSVSFPHAARYFPSAYHAIRSPDFHRRVEAQLGSEAWTRVEVASLRPGLVTLADGRELRAQHVVDARGFAAAPPVPCGYQKFFGLVIKTAKPHGLTSPILMDATVDQLDGYRFVYVLPWSDTQLLVEDTYYSDSPRLNRSELRRRVEAYAAQ